MSRCSRFKRFFISIDERDLTARETFEAGSVPRAAASPDLGATIPGIGSFGYTLSRARVLFCLLKLHPIGYGNARIPARLNWQRHKKFPLVHRAIDE